MRDYTLAHLSDAVLLRELAVLAARDRETTAWLLAHIAEVDARKAYAPAGHASLFAYCVEELRFSEDAAYKRIQAARAARQFPILFQAVAEGRLHLTAVCLLAPHLTAQNVEALVEAATNRKKFEIEASLAARFGVSRAAVPSISTVTPLQSARGVGSESELALEQVGSGAGTAESERVRPSSALDAAGEAELALEQVASAWTEPSPERFLVRVTIDKPTHERLVRAQALLSHAIPSGDVAQVLYRALGTLIEKLEKRKIGSGSSRVRRSSKASTRHIPAHVRRAVWERDQGQCTFAGANGRRCGARRFLEFDHVEPVARGGAASVDGLRLRCRMHNQVEAERVFGAGFMAEKREAARLARAGARARNKATREREAREQDQDVVAGLRGLGCRADEARRAAEFTRDAAFGTIEERMRAALSFLARRSRRVEVGTRDPVTIEVGHVRERLTKYGLGRRRGPGLSGLLARERRAVYRCRPHSRVVHHPPPSRAAGRRRPSSRTSALLSRRHRAAPRAAHATLAPCTPSPIRSAI